MEFTKKQVAQYEAIRRSGQVNMLDTHGVMSLAYQYDFEELERACISLTVYGQLLKQYSSLMTRYGLWELEADEIEELAYHGV